MDFESRNQIKRPVGLVLRAMALKTFIELIVLSPSRCFCSSDNINSRVVSLLRKCFFFIKYGKIITTY